MSLAETDNVSPSATLAVFRVGIPGLIRRRLDAGGFSPLARTTPTVT